MLGLKAKIRVSLCRPSRILTLREHPSRADVQAIYFLKNGVTCGLQFQVLILPRMNEKNIKVLARETILDSFHG